MRQLRLAGAMALAVTVVLSTGACATKGGGSESAAADSATSTTVPATLTLPARPGGGPAGATTAPKNTPTTTAPTTTAPATSPPATAAPTTAAPTTAPAPSGTDVDVCGDPVGDWLVTVYTTARFEVSICTSLSGPDVFYRGRNLDTGDRIDLPAEVVDLGVYATNGEVEYYVNAETLEVYRGDEQILSEPVLSVR